MNIRRTIKCQWLKFRRLQGDPKKIALGAALGVFIGITPTIPFHTVLLLILAPLLRVSLIAGYMGIWISNPLTWVPQYLAAYEVGALLLFRGDSLVIPEHANLAAYLHLIWRGGLALQVGGLIIAVPAALLTYFITLWAVRRYRRRQGPLESRVQLIPKKRSAASRPEA
jgi:uncharacterized protein (DUF2062 family)